MTPRPYLNRTYSQVPSHEQKTMTGTYTIHGGLSCRKAQPKRMTPIEPAKTWMNGIMTGEHNG